MSNSVSKSLKLYEERVVSFIRGVSAMAPGLLFKYIAQAPSLLHEMRFCLWIFSCFFKRVMLSLTVGLVGSHYINRVLRTLGSALLFATIQ